MDIGTALGVAVVAYLIGSISFARIVGKRVLPDADLSHTELSVPGGATIEYTGVSATTIGARTGPRWGLVVGFADIAKAFVPTLAARLIWPDDSYHLIVAVVVVVGHNYPVFYRFKGGRGQSPLLGGLLAVDWLAFPVTTVVGGFLGLVVVKDMLVAYGAGQALMIPWFIWRGGAPEVAYAVVVNLLFLIATLPEIKIYLEKRRAGELRQVESWRDLKTSHPAMGPAAGSNEDDDG
jgi:glycerol-3-phosphate acyltransferase PlsY